MRDRLAFGIIAFLLSVLWGGQVFGQSVRLTQKEKAFLDTHPVILLGTDKRWEPFAIENFGMVTGYDVDILNEINRLTGANFELKVGLWTEVLQEAKDGELAGVTTSVAHKERKRSFVFSKPYLSLTRMVMTLRGNASLYKSMEDLEGKKIIYQKGNLFNQKMAMKVPEATLLEAATVDEMLEALAYGKADVVLGNAAYMYRASKLGMTTLEFAFNLPESLELVVSFRKDMAVARDIFDKGLQSISPNVRTAIHNKWFGSLPQSVSNHQELIKVYAFWAISIVFCIACVLYLVRMNRRLSAAEKKAQESAIYLHESERRLTTLIFNLPGAVFQCRNDENWTMEYLSDVITDISGYLPAEIINNEAVAFNDLIHSDDQALVRKTVLDALGKYASYEVEYRITKKDGDIVFVWEAGCGVYENGELVRLEGFITDITERKRIEDDLKSSERRFSNVFEGTSDGLWDWDILKNTIYLNPQWYKMLGYEYQEFEGTFENWNRLLHPDDVEKTMRAVEEHLKSSAPFVVEFRMKSKEGGWCWILSRGRVVERDNQGSPVRMSGTHTDITYKKELEAQLAMARKLEAVGQLSAGVAHEINTPVQYIGGNLKYIGKTLENRESMKDESTLVDLKNAALESLEGLEKISKIVNALKMIAHQKTGDVKAINIHDVISNAVTVSRNAWKYFADLEYEYDPDFPTVYCDPGEMEQLVLNLLINAAHALEDKYGATEERGQLFVRTSTNDGRVEIEVRDTGSGIAADVLPRIYDPFFTTKEMGRGTGQGLSIVYSLVKKYSGDITVSSETNEGTTFVVSFPSELSG